MQKFEIGSLVHLKSGSPALTVIDYTPPKDPEAIGPHADDGAYQVVWFSNGEVHGEAISSDALIGSENYYQHVLNHGATTHVKLAGH